jgi:hypothetical protein
MEELMDFFFQGAGSTEFSVAFGAAYVAALNSLELTGRLRVLNNGLIKRTFEAMKGPEFAFPRNVFVFRLAEKLCDENLLEFDRGKLNPESRAIMKSKEWGEMAQRVIQQRDFIAGQIVAVVQKTY